MWEILPEESNPQTFDYRSTALPLQLERSPRILKFDYLNPATCIYYDIDNNLIVMFWHLQARIFTFNRLSTFWPKGSASSLGFRVSSL